MLEALWIWRQFPRQIASDLHARGQHIKHWLRATRGADGDLILSSYELLYILEFLPEKSAFKTAAERGGRWTGLERMVAEIANEQYRMRSSYFAVNSEGGELGFSTDAYEFIDPVDQARRAADAVTKAIKQSQSQDDFESQIGYTRTDQEG